MSHKKYRTEKNCLNCGTEVMGRFCHQCGQENIDTHDNFVHMVGHFAFDYLHFDSKFFRSLIPLFSKPGFLTKEYWEGRRAHYIPPLRLFFFTTIIFMFSTTAFYKHFGDEMKNEMVKPDKRLSQVDSAYIDNLEDRELARKLAEDKVRELQQVNQLRKGVDDFFKYLKYVTFFLLPVYALLFKLLYLRRKSFYVDHIVYVMHLQAFIYSFFTLALLLPFVFPKLLGFILPFTLIVLFAYVVISLHYLYKQGWGKTLLKSVLATFMLFFVTTFVMIGYAIIDAFLIR